MPHHALCVTGLERSFTEIARNILHILHGLNRSAAPTGRLHIFGIEPVNESWSPMLHSHMLLSARYPQRRCHGNAAVPWFTCTRGGRTTRGGRCADSFLQSLCDLRACKLAMQEYEVHHGIKFLLVGRLRLDVAFEADMALPSFFHNGHQTPVATTPETSLLTNSIDENTVWVPHMNSQVFRMAAPMMLYAPALLPSSQPEAADSQGGFNDKFALGGRRGMFQYFSRVELTSLNFSTVPRDAKGVSRPPPPHWTG